MPQDIRIVDQKFFYESRNGTDFNLNTNEFTDHLKGNVLDKVKAQFKIQLNYYVELQTNTFSNYFDNTNVDNITNFGEIYIEGNGFLSDGGFSVGDYIKYTGLIPNTLPDNEANFFWATGTISSVSETELKFVCDQTPTQKFTVVWANVWAQPLENATITGLSAKKSLKFKYGLIENNESFNTLSKLTNTDQVYVEEQIDIDSPNTFSLAKPQGKNKAWRSEDESLSVAFVGRSFDKDKSNITPLEVSGYPLDGTLEYEIRHVFNITPFYRDGELDALKGVVKPPLDIYNGDKSLKYVFEAEFREEVNNPNSKITVKYENFEGSVGYFGENYNGFKDDYSISDLSYTVGGNTVSKIDAGKLTSVSFKVNDSGGNYSSPNVNLIVGHSSIIPSDDYSYNLLEFNKVWNKDSLRANVNDSSLSSDYIKNFSFNVDNSSTLSVFFDVDLTNANIESGQDYILYCITENFDAQNLYLSGKVTELIDVNIYDKSSDIDGLWNVEKFEQYPHAEEFEQGLTTGFTNAKGFNETGYFTDITVKKVNNSTLEDLSFEFVVYNTSTKEHYTLRTFEFDLSSSFLANGIQNIELDTDRGYVLKDNDLFNIVKIETVGSDSLETEYSIQLGYKTAWQSWLKWEDAPSDFYDKTKPQFNLNQKSSTYSKESSLNNYELRVFLKANVEQGGIVTEYINSSEEFEVFDYDTDDLTPDGFTCEVNTFNKNGEKIQGNLIKQDFTELRAIFTPVVPPTFSEKVDMSEVANNWNRFAHGNKCNLNFNIQTRLNGVNQLDVEGSWENEQAGEVNGVKDTFNNSGLNNVILPKDSPLLYTSTTDEIIAQENLSAYYGCFSPFELEYYDISGEMFSSASDNDCIAYNIAFYVDENGIENTISLMATTGGVLLDLDPNYNPNDLNSSTIRFLPDAPDNVCSWGLVYNFGKTDCKQLDIFRTTNPVTDWGDLNQTSQTFNFEVKKSANLIEVNCAWNLPFGNFNNTFNLDLNSDPLLSKFKGFNSIGFSFMSQDQGGFKNVVLTKPEGDYYGILRIEPEESQSDFGINELSTVNEAPEGNFLKQITGDKKLSLLSWDGTSFILQGEVDTSRVEEGQKYKLSAELRQLNLQD